LAAIQIHSTRPKIHPSRVFEEAELARIFVTVHIADSRNQAVAVIMTMARVTL
jgi:hypothetical protein